MTSPGTEYLGMYITIAYTVIAMIAGGVVAVAKKDYAGRGVAVSMLSGLFGPLFMALDRPSGARQGAEEIWPTRGPEAAILNIVLLSVFNYFV